MARIEPIPYEDLPTEAKAEIERQRVLRGRLSKGSLTNRQIRAYAPRPMVEQGLRDHPNFDGETLVEARILELVRLYGAILSECELCVVADLGPDDPDDAVGHTERAALRAGDLSGFSDREQSALRFTALLHNDHHGLNDDFYREMATEFTTAEIVELGFHVSPQVGMQRWLHSLDVDGVTPPAIPYDASQVNTSRVKGAPLLTG